MYFSLTIVQCVLTTGEDVSGDNESAEETTVRRKRWYRLIKPKTHSSYHDPNSKTSKGTAYVRF